MKSEMKHYPLHWDDQTRSLVSFMLMEAFRSGRQIGYELGKGTGQGIAVGMLHDVIAKLQEQK